jgi:outer membrane protein OmpA-like peptidoglycan-associated protein
MKRSMTIMMLAVGASPLFACRTTTPTELIEARAAYRRAETGPAAQHARGQLSTAKRALERAEAEFDDDGNDRDTRDYAYIAARLSGIAETQARLTVAQNERTETQRRLEIVRAEQQRATEEALGMANQELSELDREKAAALAQAGEEAKKAEQERLARLEAERREKDALEALERIGQVKEESRGYVVNITGAVLFAPGKSTLLRSAEGQLMTLVDALRAMPSEQKVIIEGHTDSTGSDSMNQKLSEARAAAVKNFLVRNGIENDRLETAGMGESDPVAENTTSEGRATNRRVEIVIEKAT